MANEQQTELQDLSAEELKERANSFFDQYKTPIFAGIGAILLLVVGVYWYTRMYKAPREDKAQLELYRANIAYQQDSFQLALNGNVLTAQPGQANVFMGYTGIISEYGGTDAANLAHYFAGASTLRLGQPQLAIEFLEAFSGEELMQTQAYNMMGDAYGELQKLDEALNYYKKAADYTDNAAISIYSKYKAARLLEVQGNKDEARKYYQAIMDEDAQLAESMGVDKDLVRLQ